jgi:hypothetical protein
MKKASQHKIDSIVNALKEKVLEGRYKEGVIIARKALRSDPENFVFQYQYAKLLGDWADELPAKTQSKYKKEAASILQKLTGRLSGKSFELRFGICLNYYYQKKEFKQMYAYGKRLAKTNKQKAYYSQGLGATLLGFDYWAEKRFAKAATWAKKATRAWQKYDLKSEKYYFAHYSYAKALALEGRSKEAMASLKAAARLSKRKLSDWEFEDVLKLL